MAWRYMEKDFRMRSTYGAVAGSTLEDWPIGYDDLEPYYEKAEWEMGVSGDDSNNIFKAPAPQAAAHAAAGAEPASTQILSRPPSAWGCIRSTFPCCATRVPYNGRRPCMRCRWCVGFACEVNARTGTHNTVIPRGAGHRATASCAPSAWPARFCWTTAAAPRASPTSTRSGRLQEQPADLVVVCGGAIESARLLLNTKHRLFPNGLGNRYDWVGRNLQGHAYPARDRPVRLRHLRRPGPRRLHRHLRLQPRQSRAWPAAAMLANEFIRLPYQFADHRAAGRAALGAGAQGLRAASAYKRTIAVMGPVQEMPVFDARVQVDPKVKDYWGIPVARLSGDEASAHARDRQVTWPAKRRLAEGSRRRRKPGRGVPQLR